MLSLLLAVVALEAALRTPVPSALAMPPGATLKVSLEGDGVQIYTCATQSGSASYGWSFTAPKAGLFDPEGGDAEGRHYAGPTWESTDGSRVIGHLRAKTPSPDGAGIDWLLLDGSPSGQGFFGHIAYVRRILTKGGKAPAGGCDAGHAGQTARVHYSATYEFYTSGR